MITADFHMHSSFSADSEQQPERIIELAIERGLDTICITDHMDLLWPYPGEKFEFDTEEYFKTLGALQEKYKDKLDLRIGLEMGFRDEEDCIPIIEQRWNEFKALPFDFIIGSTHLLDHGDPYFPEFWQGKNANDVIRGYYEAMLFNVEHYNDFNVAGHIDYIARYVPEGIHYEMTRNLDIIEEILKTLINKGCGIELNVNRWIKGFPLPNPDPIILKMYKALGGEIITIGTDAHRENFIGAELGRAKDLLESIGFKHYTVFKNRKPEFRDL